ncbi:MAG: DUF3990 domain-containing protein, partial [Lachnospiraceae bacterium]|nr:DUF3990 domain-containing protein [Lachnospiraceae bacterium]
FDINHAGEGEGFQSHGFGHYVAMNRETSVGYAWSDAFDKADREWLWFIAQNRRPHLAGSLAERIDPEAFNADVIIGKVANDKTNPTITAYLNGLYGDILSERAVNFAIEVLLPNHLEDQFCFLTQKAVDCLEFQEAKKYVV